MVHLVLEKLYSLVLVPLKQTVRSIFVRTNNRTGSSGTWNEHFSNIPEVSWIGISSNVYWWWCKIGQRCIRIRIEFFLFRKCRFLENVVRSINDYSKTSIIRIFCSNSKKQKKNSLQLFSLMKLMQLVQSVLIQKKLVTEKSKEQCLNFCHNLMVSRRVISRIDLSEPGFGYW